MDKLEGFHYFTKAMNIEGLAEGTLEKLIGRGFLHSVTDIYRLDNYRSQIISLDGFSEKSWQKRWNAPLCAFPDFNGYSETTEKEGVLSNIFGE